MNSANRPSEEAPPSREALGIVVAARVIAGAGKVFGAALILSILFAGWILLQPREFTSRSSFVPQGKSEAGGASALAAQFGVTIGGSDPAQVPQYHADLLLSEQVIREALTRPLPPTAGLDRPATIEQIWNKGEAGTPESRDALVKRLRGRVQAVVNPRTGVISVAVTLPDPAMAAAVNRLLLDVLDRLNQRSRSAKAMAERQFELQRSQELQGELHVAELKVQQFLLRNRGDFRAAPELNIEYERLARAVVMLQQVYTATLQSYEQSRIEEVRNTPVIAVIEEPTIPAIPDARHLLLGTASVMLLVSGASVVLIAMSAAWPSTALARLPEMKELEARVRRFTRLGRRTRKEPNV